MLAESLRRAFPLLCGAMGQDDDPTLPADHLHRTCNLWQRRHPFGCSVGDTNDSPNDLTSHYGSARGFDGISPLFGHRRFRVSTWLSVWHDPREFGDP